MTQQRDSQPAPKGNDDTPPHRYNAAMADAIERAWQARWEEQGTHRVPNPGEAGFDASRPKFYCLDMFPYPSGAGLHVGHPEGYTATDIVSRFKRMKGFNVLHPMGWDAFGLPAEQYAIQTGIHPKKTTRESIDNFRRQLKRFGFSYDWSREFGTIDEEFYKWTQWIFLKIYGAWFDKEETKRSRDAETKGGGRARPIAELVGMLERGEVAAQVNPDAHEARPIVPAPASWAACNAEQKRSIVDSYRLAYLAETTVNWCPRLGTVLANDEVIDGKSERGGYPVLRKPLKQWVFRITAFAERLLRQLDDLDWFESTKTMQREWIGRSEGAEIEFPVLGSPTLRVGLSSAERADAVDANPECAMRPNGFVARDPYPEGIYGPVRDLITTRRNLPHLRVENATYFVTWKCVEGMTLDEEDRGIALRALLHFDDQRCRVYGVCVMNNHVHWLVRPFPGHDLLELRESVKHFAASQINKQHGRSGRVWEPEGFDHIVRDGGYFAEFLAYMVRNPVEAGLVRRAGDCPHTFVHEDALGGSPHAERGGTQRVLRVFTTRPDTIFGATYMVVAPEHELVGRILRGEAGVDEATRAKVRDYATWAKNRSDIERQEAKEKTGVFTGVYCVNPATGEKIPVWTADYVLMGYGTGAIMAVPAGDERDWEFAKKFDLPIRLVVIHTAQGIGHRFIVQDTGLTGQQMQELSPKLNAFGGMQWETMRDGNVGRIYFDSQRSAQEFGRVVLGKSDVRITSGLPEILTSNEPYTGEGVCINSANAEVSLNGLHTPEAKTTIIAWLEKKGIGVGKVNYRLRDWVFSRQRYWGEPFPIVYDDAGHAYPVMDSHLPVKLPELADYAPNESDDPQPLLAKAGDWVRTTAGAAGVDPKVLPPQTPVTRETNTMPGSAGSSWYAVRYCDARNGNRFVGREAEQYWMGGNSSSPALRAGAGAGVDLYLGGSEHAVGHLLYSRFWQNVLFDLGEVSTREPFRKLFHQGLITSFAYQRGDKSLVPTDAVEEKREGVFIEKATGKPVTQIVAKMSKSLKNVVNPDDVIAEYGADTFRLYEMAMGPLDASKPWNPRDIAGCFRFLQRAWRVCVDEHSGAIRGAAEPGGKLERQLHRLIRKVEGDIERLAFNTAIAAMIEFVNSATAATGADKGAGVLTRDQIDRFMLVLGPFAPHIAEEVRHRLGHKEPIVTKAWPTADPAMLADNEVEIPISVMGKVRTRIMVPTAAAAEAKSLEDFALAHEAVKGLLAGKAVKKVIAVPGRMVNLVVG